MISGSFGRFDETNDIRQKILHNRTFDHELEGNPVTAIVQLDRETTRVRNQEIISGLVIDYRMIKLSNLEEQDGRFHVRTDVEPRQVWAEFQIIGKDLVRAYSSYGRDIVLPVLSHALGANTEFIRYANFDLQRVYGDYRGHWIGSIYDREGHMQKGTFYGNHLEKDDVIGHCWKINKKGMLGFETEYFGNESLKIRVTKEGSAQVYNDEIPDERYLRFVLDELKEYMIDEPRTRRRRTF